MKEYGIEIDGTIQFHDDGKGKVRCGLTGEQLKNIHVNSIRVVAGSGYSRHCPGTKSNGYKCSGNVTQPLEFRQPTKTSDVEIYDQPCCIKCRYHGQKGKVDG